MDFNALNANALNAFACVANPPPLPHRPVFDQDLYHCESQKA